MTSILSSVSGQFSKALLLGAFFPTTLFVIFAWLFLTPLLPTDWIFLQPLKALDPQWQLAALTITTVVLSGILYNLNIPLIRVYEGYRWQDTSVGRWFTQRQENKCADLLKRYERLKNLGSVLPGGDKNPCYSDLITEWDRLGRTLANDFPRTYGILPTRLGNVLRSFEEYPDYQYGIDGITLWPRLVYILEDKDSSAIDGARIPFDFMINSAFLSSVLAGLLVIAGLFNPVLLSSWSMWRLYLPWLVQIAGLVIASYLFYLGAIAQAYSWGNMVKGAFDLYKSKLLSQLGYKNDVSTRAAEYDLWDKISRQMLYGNDPGTDKPETDYVSVTPSPAPPTYVEYKDSQSKGRIQLTRGVAGTERKTATTVHIRVKNIHPKDNCDDVVITDKLPEGFDYEWDTAHVGEARVPVEGINPYKFKIGTLKPSAEVVLTYRMTQRERLLTNVQLGL